MFGAKTDEEKRERIATAYEGSKAYFSPVLEGPTQRVHVYSRKPSLEAEGYEPVW